MPFSLGFWAAAGGGDSVPASDIELISTINPSGYYTVTFSSIPQTYKHLIIRFSTRDTTASTGNGQMYMRINDVFMGDPYSWHQLNMGSAEGYTTQPEMRINGNVIPRNSNTTGIFDGGILEIYDYANTTKFKSLKGIAGAASTDLGLRSFSGNYRSTNAVSSFTLFPASYANFVAGTRFSLYGVKG